MKNLRSEGVVLCVIFVGILAILIAGCGRKEAEKGRVPGKTASVPMPSIEPITEERTFYGFEKDLQGWEVPSWAEEKADHVAREAVISKDTASQGNSSMRIIADFPGGIWAAGLVEIQQYLDLSPYRVISADVYVPKDAPIGLKAKLILTVGSNWKFVEMNRSMPLIPGEWVKITASVEPGSYDWKRVVPDEKFAKDVRKIAIRIESNRKPKYSGPVYIDNIRAGR